MSYHDDEKVLLENGVSEILDLLNREREKLVGRKLKPITSDKNIIARLKNGGTVHECCRIIITKSKDTHFIEKKHLFHPNTLFREIHWKKYLDDAELMRPGDD